MKRLTALLMGLMCVIGLTACGGKGGETAQEKSFPTSTVQAMVEAGAFSEQLEELDADTAFMLYRLGDYGLVREDLVEAAVLRSAGGTCEEGAVLIFADGEKAAAAMEALGAYVESQIEANVDYRPADIPKLEGAVLKHKGNSALLAVPNDAAAVRSLFE